jgi:hypothetical protein
MIEPIGYYPLWAVHEPPINQLYRRYSNMLYGNGNHINNLLAPPA